MKTTTLRAGLGIGFAAAVAMLFVSPAAQAKQPDRKPHPAHSHANASNTHNNASAQSSHGFSGTIKIAAIGSTPSHANDPHPGCGFRVDFYSFRTGTYDVTISVAPPTGDAALLSDTVRLTGSPSTGYEASRSYSPSLAAYPQSANGWHLRVAVTDPNKPGNGAKTKVFWMQCAGASSASASSSAESAASGSRASRAEAPASSGTAAVLGERLTATTTAQTNGSPAGRASTVAAAATSIPVLAHTGVAVAWIAGLGALVTLCGWMLLRRVNRI